MHCNCMAFIPSVKTGLVDLAHSQEGHRSACYLLLLLFVCFLVLVLVFVMNVPGCYDQSNSIITLLFTLL